MEGRVAVLIDKGRVGFVLEEHQDDVPVAVGSGQVEGRVVAHIGGVNAGPPLDQHLDNLGVATLGSPVQGGELMVVPGLDKRKTWLGTFLCLSLDPLRIYK